MRSLFNYRLQSPPGHVTFFGLLITQAPSFSLSADSCRSSEEILQEPIARVTVRLLLLSRWQHDGEWGSGQPHPHGLHLSCPRAPMAKAHRPREVRHIPTQWPHTRSSPGLCSSSFSPSPQDAAHLCPLRPPLFRGPMQALPSLEHLSCPILPSALLSTGQLAGQISPGKTDPASSELLLSTECLCPPKTPRYKH